jgi:hypothetical protein
MDGERTIKKLLEGKPGWRKKERPRLRLLDDTELDFRKMGVKRCRTRALYRTEWVSVVRVVKAKLNPFVTSGTYTSHLQRVFSSSLG